MAEMIPAGYMFKRIAARPDWLQAESVVDIGSVSNCISEAFTDYLQFWSHNGFWLFDSAEAMTDLAKKHDIELSNTTLCYYEVYGEEFDQHARTWTPMEPDAAFPTRVLSPANRTLMGYDVVSFSTRNAPECSPLSCNGLASELPVNSHCLLASLAEATDALDAGRFDNSEPGPFRVFAVYSVP